MGQVDQVRESSLKYSDVNENIPGLGKLVFKVRIS